jgi:hypothetical protein
MKKQILLAGLAIASTSPSLQAYWRSNTIFDDFFQASERMMQDMRQNMAKAQELSKMCHQRSEAQADYTLQHYTENGLYGLLIKLNGEYGKQAPRVTINTTKNTNGQAVKELEIESVTREKDTKATKQDAAKKETYAYYTQSSTTVMHNGVVSQHVSENSRASVENGVLRVKHNLPKNVDEENYSMSFEDGQLKLEFTVIDQQPKAAKKALAYTAAPKQQEQPEPQEK